MRLNPGGPVRWSFPVDDLDLVDVSQSYMAGKVCEPGVRALERERIVAFLRHQLDEGLGSPNPESAVIMLIEEIENNEF